MLGSVCGAQREENSLKKRQEEREDALKFVAGAIMGIVFGALCTVYTAHMFTTSTLTLIVVAIVSTAIFSAGFTAKLK